MTLASATRSFKGSFSMSASFFRWPFTTIGVLSFAVWAAASQLGEVFEGSFPGQVLGFIAILGTIPAYSASMLVERAFGETALLSGSNWLSALPIRLTPFLLADAVWNVLRWVVKIYPPADTAP